MMNKQEFLSIMERLWDADKQISITINAKAITRNRPSHSTNYYAKLSEVTDFIGKCITDKIYPFDISVVCVSDIVNAKMKELSGYSPTQIAHALRLAGCLRFGQLESDEGVITRVWLVRDIKQLRLMPRSSLAYIFQRKE